MAKNIGNEYLPDTVSAPGATLAELLSDRRMKKAELAERLGLSRKHVTFILKGEAPLTPETALRLERVLGTPAGFWNNREQQYRDHLARVEEARAFAAQQDWLAKFTGRTWNRMVAFGWVPALKDPVARTCALLEFFGVASPDAWERHWGNLAVDFRKSERFAADPHALAAWLRAGEMQGRARHCAPYHKASFESALNDFRSLSLQKPDVFLPSLIERCAACGVAVALVPELPKTASGATRWLSPDRALIQLSFKYKTDDHFWFTFFHEAAHVLFHGKKEVFIEGGKDRTAKERKADEFAAETLVPKAMLESFLAETRPLTDNAIRGFAERLGIAPGIVVGRLQHDGVIPFGRGNALKRRLDWSTLADSFRNG